MNYREIDRGSQRVFLVDMRKENSFLFSDLTRNGIAKMIREGKRVCLIVNKKGFASGMICHECGYIPQCVQCDVSVAQHVGVRGEVFGLCHMCHRQYETSSTCTTCKKQTMRPYGYGIDKVAQECSQLFGCRVVSLSAKNVQSQKKIEKTMVDLYEAQIVVATGVMDIPPDGVSIDMLVVINADIGLSIPDYTAQWQTFAFLHHLLDAYKETPLAIVQSHDVEQEAILYASRGDSDTMRTYDLAYREKFLYPPYCELARILYKHEIEENVFDRVNKLYQEMLYILEAGPYPSDQIELIPTPPLVFKAFGKFRYNIIIKGKEIRNYLDDVSRETGLLRKGFKIDREPGRIV